MDVPGYDVLGQHAELIRESRRLREEAERLCAKVKQQIEHLEWLVETIRRERGSNFFRPLQDAIRTMHGGESRHLKTFAVRKVRDGEILWLGMVEEFTLDGAGGDTRCYAWQYAQDGQPRTFTLLKQGAVDSPQAAVQFFLMAETLPTADVPA